jgi:hypothetical protein
MSDDGGPMTERNVLNRYRNEIVQQKRETRNNNLFPNQQSLPVSLPSHIP